VAGKYESPGFIIKMLDVIHKIIFQAETPGAASPDKRNIGLALQHGNVEPIFCSNLAARAPQGPAPTTTTSKKLFHTCSPY